MRGYEKKCGDIRRSNIMIWGYGNRSEVIMGRRELIEGRVR